MKNCTNRIVFWFGLYLDIPSWSIIKYDFYFNIFRSNTENFCLISSCTINVLLIYFPDMTLQMKVGDQRGLNPPKKLKLCYHLVGNEIDGHR